MTILFYEGPIARSYLVALKRLGLKAGHIIQVVLTRHPTTGKALFPWAPTPLRRTLAQMISFSSAHFWPRILARKHKPVLVDGNDELCWTTEDLQEIRTPVPLDHYADRVTRILADNINAKPIVDVLAREKKGTNILFTGGGLLKDPLTQNRHLRFIHVHPGVLPEVRGADGLMWSYAVRGAPGASVFFMNTGLDTGNILHVAEYPGVGVLVSGPIPDAKANYRIVFSFLDPVVRAVTLEQFLA